MSRAVWTWLLCDQSGTPLAELATAAGRQIAYTRNSYVEAQFTISHDDDAASLLWGALASGIPTLRCYRRAPSDSAGVLRFNGYLAPFTEAAEETALLTAVFRSPFGRLVGDGPDRGRFTGASVAFTATDAGQIAKSLIDTTNAAGATGLATTGTIEATVTRARTYQWANVGQAVIDLTNVQSGFDFSETFLESGSTLAEFSVHAILGDDRPAARFEYGPGTLANVRNMGRTTQPPINVAIVLGASGLSSTATDTASVALDGRWEALQTLSDVSEQATLDARARAMLRPRPIKTVTFTPDYGLPNCPQPFDDFAPVGDTVRFRAARGALNEDVAVRVNGMTLVIDDNGFEVAEIPDPQTPDEQATLRASLSIEVPATS